MRNIEKFNGKANLKRKTGRFQMATEHKIRFKNTLDFQSWSQHFKRRPIGTYPLFSGLKFRYKYRLFYF